MNLIEQKTSIEVLKNEVQSVANVNSKLDGAIDKIHKKFQCIVLNL